MKAWLHSIVIELQHGLIFIPLNLHVIYSASLIEASIRYTLPYFQNVLDTGDQVR